jgi:hypothetical protein
MAIVFGDREDAEQERDERDCPPCLHCGFQVQAVGGELFGGHCGSLRVTVLDRRTQRVDPCGIGRLHSNERDPALQAERVLGPAERHHRAAVFEVKWSSEVAG